MSTLSTKILCTSALFLFIVASAFAKDLGTVGATYAINEPDALTEMENRAKQIDWEKTVKKNQMESVIKGFRPKEIKKLPRAAETRTFTVDMTYALDFDIRDANGDVIYPKGFTYNPLDYISYPGTIVVIDGTDRGQVNWFKRSKWVNDINVKLLITDGSYYELSKELKRPVFYAVKGIAERFQLQHVPAVVYQKGKVMEIVEIDVDKVAKKRL